MNFSTISSKVSGVAYLKMYLGLLVAFGGMPVLITGAIFLINPALFYSGPWEYFGEVAYRVPSIPPVWQGIKTGDLANDNLIFFQEKHYTSTTVDQDGFRVTPIQSNNYPIVVSGDSTIYGLALSDHKTVPWRVAELTGIPVFNGGRSPLFNVLKKPELSRVRLVIDCRFERLIDGSDFFYAENVDAPYVPLALKNMDRFNVIFEVPFERYSVLHMLMRILKRLMNDMIDFVNGVHTVEYKFFTHHMTPDTLERSIATILQRAQTLHKQGIDYWFVAVPAKQTIYKDDVDEFTRQYIPTLVKELKKLGVKAIDLTKSFTVHKDVGLYHHYDTHWNKNGAEVAAQVISEELMADREMFITLQSQ